MDKPKLDLEKTLTSSQIKKLLDKTTEEHQVLRATIQEVLDEELEKYDKRTLQKFDHIEQLLQQIISIQEQVQQLEQSKWKGEKKQKSILTKLRNLFVSKK